MKRHFDKARAYHHKVCRRIGWMRDGNVIRWIVRRPNGDWYVWDVEKKA